MKKLILITLGLFSFNAFGFTLLYQPVLKFSKNDIVVNVASNTCTQSVTPAELLDLVEKAVDEHWNRVATCAIKFSRGSIVSVDVSGDTGSEARAKAELGTILVGCSTTVTGTTLGVGGNSGTDRGSVLLNDSNTSFANLSETDKLATIAHEIGHAMGLGHSSDPVAMMYYAVGGTIREKLTLDDYDGCTYLYPHDSPGSCNSIAPIKDEDGGSPTKTSGFFLLFALGLMASLLFGKFLRSKM